jgi:hypothetical protein
LPREPKPLGFSLVDVFATHPIDRRSDRERTPLNSDNARVEAGNVEKRAEEPFERIDRGLDLVDQRLSRSRQNEAAPRADKETEGVNRLAQVMAGGGEEFRLGEVGALRDVSLPLEIVGHFLGADLQAHELIERPVRSEAEPAHSGDEDQHQEGRDAMQERIGGEEARDGERKGRGKKEGEERRQMGTEGSDRSRRNTERHQ